MELVKFEIEHKKPNSVGFFILQYALLRMLELHYKFLDKYCDVTKYEEQKVDTDSLYLAIAEQDFYDCFRPEMKEQ